MHVRFRRKKGYTRHENSLPQNPWGNQIQLRRHQTARTLVVALESSRCVRPTSINRYNKALHERHVCFACRPLHLVIALSRHCLIAKNPVVFHAGCRTVAKRSDLLTLAPWLMSDNISGTNRNSQLLALTSFHLVDQFNEVFSFL